MDFTSSSRLQQLGNHLRQRTTLRPTAKNPRHRIAASITLPLPYCELHRFETSHVRAAEKHNWPSSPDFIHLWERLVRLRPQLEDTLIAEDSEFYLDLLHLFDPGNTISEQARDRMLHERSACAG